MAQPIRGKSNNPNNVSDWLEIDVPSRLPIIPLVSSVLFPGGVLSLQVGIFVEEVERAVDRVVIGQRDERHPALFGDAVDVLRRVVAVSSIGPFEVFEDRKPAVTVQIRSFEGRIREHIGDDGLAH